jgi:hypothetical protein
MYIVDDLDKVIALRDVPRCDAGAPSPIVLSDEQRLYLSYWEAGGSDYFAKTASLAVVRFLRPRMHYFGPPNDEAIAGHPLAKRGLRSYAAFWIQDSSLIRRLEIMNSVHRRHDPSSFKALTHFIFTFHDSTFECVAELGESTIEEVGSNEEYVRTLRLFESGEPTNKLWTPFRTAHEG